MSSRVTESIRRLVELGEALPTAHELQSNVESSRRALEDAASAYSRGGEDLDIALHLAAMNFAGAVGEMDAWLVTPVSVSTAPPPRMEEVLKSAARVVEVAETDYGDDRRRARRVLLAIADLRSALDALASPSGEAEVGK